jgi:hypothetical protein
MLSHSNAVSMHSLVVVERGGREVLVDEANMCVCARIATLPRAHWTLPR